MSFTGNEGEGITLSEAAAMTLSFRNSITNILTGLLNPNHPLSYTINKANLLDLLNQTDCVGVKTYYGIKSTGVRTIVLVGVKANEDDLHAGIILDHEGESITLSAAATLTQNFRTSITNILTQILDGTKVQAVTIGKTTLMDLLNQTGNEGVRLYYGLDENGKKSPVLVGVDEFNEDMSEGIVLNHGIRCPPECASINALNSIL